MDETRKTPFLLRRGPVGCAVIIVAALTGSWLGQWMGPAPLSSPNAPQGELGDAGGAPGGVERVAPPSHVYFHAGGGLEEADSVAFREMNLAAKAGVHQVVFPLGNLVPWRQESEDEVLARFTRVTNANPMAAWMLQVDLNPSEAWLDAHDHDCLRRDGDGKRYPSLHCEAWQTAAAESLEQLVVLVENHAMKPRRRGYILSALEGGQWRVSSGIDTSADAGTAFQHWLQGRYGNEDALQKAWAVKDLSFQEAVVPETTQEEDPANVFYDLPKEMRVVDFLRFNSESVADSIAAFAAVIRKHASDDPKVLAPYGYSYEFLENSSGHLALNLLLNSDISGFVSPVSYADRGIGGTGFVMGPVNSVRQHGKSWLLMDDTRTGITWNAQNGTVERLRGLRAEDIRHVQQRNFALAMSHELQLAWSDPIGEGWLQDTEQWDFFGRMQEAYQRLRPLGKTTNAQMGHLLSMQIPGRGGPGKEDTAEEGVTGAPEAEMEEKFDIMVAPSDAPMALTVVLDENSQFYQRCDLRLNEILIRGGIQSALRAGIETRFCLLQDVLDGIAAPSSAYLFLNAFQLSDAERETLHALFAQERASVIWLYAPGYLEGQAASAENISKTVAMKVKAFEKPEGGGSSFAISGSWMKKENAFGSPLTWGPLFYVEDDSADTLGAYLESKRVSAAMRALETGWTSVYIADPGLPAAMLREVLRILEQHCYFRPSKRPFFDLSQVCTLPDGRKMLAVHANKTGERTINLNGFHYVKDLFETTALQGRAKESFILPMRNGETKIFLLSPI
jgi:hypothetical protein